MQCVLGSVLVPCPVPTEGHFPVLVLVADWFPFLVPVVNFFQDLKPMIQGPVTRTGQHWLFLHSWRAACNILAKAHGMQISVRFHMSIVVTVHYHTSSYLWCFPF
jgi:hypothetical protein